MLKRLLFFSILAVSFLYASAHDKVRVACVGNSVTYGYGLAHRDVEAFPVRLQALLGDEYAVRNFGHTGATLLSRGYKPYVLLPEFREALRFRPDVVVVHLGLNDTDPRCWPQCGDDFIPDLRALIDSFRAVNANVDVRLCLLTPIFHDHPRFDSGTRLWHEFIRARIRQVAETTAAGLIDLYTPMHVRPDLFPDALHPNAEGADSLAHIVYRALTGNYGGLRLPATYGNGMVIQRDRPITISGIANAGECVSVTFCNREASAVADVGGRWRIVLPAQPAGGPYRLCVEAASGKRCFDDVWLGEVWLCSGQSNMELTVSETATATEDIAAADALARVHIYNMPAISYVDARVWDAGRLDSINRLLFVREGHWERSNARAVAHFSSIAYNFARQLADSLGCHVGVISNAVGGSCAENWIDRTTLECDFPAILRHWTENDFITSWPRERAKLNMRSATNPRQRHPYEPAYLFECAVRPLADFAVRGVLWYQGESNANNAEVHDRIFPLLEKSWRKHFNDADLPFYTVQISSLATRPSWPRFREGQRRLAETQPATYMVVTTDIGDSLNIHPQRKREVADRLVRSALCHTYGRTDIVPSGPAFDGMEAEGSRLRLHFRFANGLRPATGGRLIGFEVAGADGLYHAASATIDADEVVVESRAVSVPVAVRYGWQPFTRANLVNAAGLPASTFCSEQWEE